jgi:hypothetical protein
VVTVSEGDCTASVVFPITSLCFAEMVLTAAVSPTLMMAANESDEVHIT